MSRLPEEPIPVEVLVDGHGRPAQIRRERLVTCEVVNRWRVDDDWWRVPISRMYYKVVAGGTLVEIFRDLNTGGWYIERVVD